MLLVLSVQPSDSVMCVYIYVYTHTERDIYSGHELLRKVSNKTLLSKWICIPT